MGEMVLGGHPEEGESAGRINTNKIKKNFSSHVRVRVRVRLGLGVRIRVRVRVRG
jgi:hypothetical protein